jgi:acetyl esterase
MDMPTRPEGRLRAPTRVPHPYHQAIIDAYRAMGRPNFHQVSPSEARELLRSAVAAAPLPADLPMLRTVENVLIEGRQGPIPLRLYYPSGEALGTCVFFHGGGWVIGDLDQCDSTCRRLAGRAGCRVVSVDYRLAPEHPFPRPLDDCWAALCWAFATYSGSVIVAGESAGGNLAAACAIRARDSGGPRLAGQLLICPVTDHAVDTLSYREFGDRDWLISTADMRWFWDHYCPPQVDRNHPLVSPLRVAETADLAPSFVMVGGLDPLRDEGLAYARRLAEGGVSVSLRCDAGMVHGYLAASATVPAARDALSDALHWVHLRLGEDFEV